MTAATDPLHRIEEELAHLRRMTDELSELAAAQGRQIDLLTRRVQLLMERAAEAEAEASGTLPIADRRPPHW
ncbi:SlyX family protein [Albidovulum sp.]